ncbi:MAG: 50S ribosomal protein L3 glutamine methyltransferase [Porticoccaceae bacterium]|nr:MAG: 50S ribosomal protein L3 glutamine methyltransferase [Porticoccaceae bacterium]
MHPVDELLTPRHWLRYALAAFRRAGIHCGQGTDNPWDEAVWLVHHALGLPPEGDVRLLDAPLSRDERLRIWALIDRRVRERVPAAYLTGEAWFAGLPFTVDPRVIIPRSPIAELVERRFAPWLKREPRAILDLCTGSGCIGIACAHAFPEARVDLVDLCPDALAVAALNVERHALGDRVRLVRSDLFAALEGARYDLIVSNPPYVGEGELADLPPEFRHEPRLALAGGEDGLALVRRILAEAPAHLEEGGLLVVEVGGSRPALEAAFPQLPFVWVEFERGGEGVFALQREDLDALQ